MYKNYLGRDLYNKINDIVNKSFHKIYRYSDDNQCYIETINLDYSLVEDGSYDDLPLIYVALYCNTIADGEFKVTIDYFLDETDEYNIGRMAHQFEIAIDGE